MIRVNLMPRAEARRQAARQRDRQIGLVLASVVSLVILIAELMTRTELNEAEHTTDLYKTQLAELERKHKEASRLAKMRDELRAKLRTIEVLERRRTGPVRVLEDLSDATPDKLWLTEMRESGGSVSLFGRGLDNQTIASFMERLEESAYFNQVDLIETKQVQEGKAKLKEFSIRAVVAYAGSGEKEEPEAAAAQGEEAPAVQKKTGDAIGGSPEQAADAGTGSGLVENARAAERVATDLEARQDARDATAREVVGPSS